MPKPLPLQSPCPRTTSSGHVLLILFVMCITTPRAQAKKSFVPVTLPDPGKIPESATDTERNPTFFYGRWAPPAPSANTPQSGEEVSSGRDVRVFADLPSEAEAQSVFVDQQGAPSPFTVPFHSVQREGMVEAPVQQQTDQIEQAPAAVTPSREVGAYQPGEEAPAFALPPSPFHQRDVPEARELYQSSPQSAFSPSAVSFVKQREGEEEGQSRRMARQGEAKKAVAIMGPFLSPQPHHSASPTGPFIVSADEPPPSTNNVIYVREPPRTHVVFIPRDPTPPSPSLKLHQFPMPMSVSVTTTPSPLPSVSVMTGPEGADLREYEVKRLDSPHQVPDGTMNHTTVITSTSRGSPWGGRPGITTVTHIRRAVPVRLVRRPVHPDFTVLVGSRRPPNYGRPQLPPGLTTLMHKQRQNDISQRRKMYKPDSNATGREAPKSHSRSASEPTPERPPSPSPMRRRRARRPRSEQARDLDGLRGRPENEEEEFDSATSRRFRKRAAASSSRAGSPLASFEAPPMEESSSLKLKGLATDADADIDTGADVTLPLTLEIEVDNLKLHVHKKKGGGLTVDPDTSQFVVHAKAKVGESSETKKATGESGEEHHALKSAAAASASSGPAPPPPAPAEEAEADKLVAPMTPPPSPDEPKPDQETPEPEPQPDKRRDIFTKAQEKAAEKAGDLLAKAKEKAENESRETAEPTEEAPKPQEEEGAPKPPTEETPKLPEGPPSSPPPTNDETASPPAPSPTTPDSPPSGQDSETDTGPLYEHDLMDALKKDLDREKEKEKALQAEQSKEKELQDTPPLPTPANTEGEHDSPPAPRFDTPDFPESHHHEAKPDNPTHATNPQDDLAKTSLPSGGPLSDHLSSPPDAPEPSTESPKHDTAPPPGTAATTSAENPYEQLQPFEPTFIQQTRLSHYPHAYVTYTPNQEPHLHAQRETRGQVLQRRAVAHSLTPVFGRAGHAMSPKAMSLQYLPAASGSYPHFAEE